jgi:DNA-binding NarL/FixJ family response regulator
VMKTASAFVLKRSAATDLLPAVQAVLKGGEYVSPALRATLAEMSAVSRDQGAISQTGTDSR